MSTFDAFKYVDIDEYAAPLSNPDVFWFLHHIPKTAGSSLVQELRRGLSPYCNIYADMRPGDTRTHDAALMDAVKAFLAEQPAHTYRSASGHLTQRHLAPLLETLPAMRMLTFLRRPADRLISDYRYARTPMHPPHEAFTKQFPTIEHYVEDRESQNKMWHFLAPPRSIMAAETLHAIFCRYSFIGTVETLAEDFAFFTALTGQPQVLAARVNVTQDRVDNKVEKSSALMTRIEKLNEKDYMLYEAVERSLEQRREQMHAFVEEQRAGLSTGRAN